MTQCAAMLFYLLEMLSKYWHLIAYFLTFHNAQRHIPINNEYQQYLLYISYLQQ